MGKKGQSIETGRYKDEKKRKIKEQCCEKYLKKGKHCKDCPLRNECDLPE